MSMTADILVVGFNRPASLQRCLDKLAQLGVEDVFVAIDGPRSHLPSDADRVHACRTIITSTQRLKVAASLLRDDNLGCKVGVSSAVTWFLHKVGAGLVIEDDVDLTPEFLRFGTEMLKRYRSEPRVGMVNGWRPPAPWSDRHDYTFTWYGSSWGWGTWEDRWRAWSDAPRSHFARRDLDALAGSRILGRFYFFQQVAARQGADSWLYWWNLARLRHGLLAVTPSTATTANVGFGPAATHTRSGPHAWQQLPSFPLRFPLEHPNLVRPDLDADLDIVRMIESQFWHSALPPRLRASGARVKARMSSRLNRGRGLPRS